MFRSQGVALGWIGPRLWRWNMDAQFAATTNPQGVALGWIGPRLWRWNMNVHFVATTNPQGVALGWIGPRLWRWKMNAHAGPAPPTRPAATSATPPFGNPEGVI